MPADPRRPDQRQPDQRQSGPAAAKPRQPRRLVAVPSDPIAAYELSGCESLLEYCNPLGLFEEIVVLSPFECSPRTAHGLRIEPVEWIRFRQVAAALKPAAVRAYGGHWPARLAAGQRIPGVPVLVSVHDSRAALLDRRLRYADLVLCVSGAVERVVCGRGVRPERIRRLPNRVDLARFRPMPRSEWAALERRFPPGRRILQVGRLSPEKNQATLIRALLHLPSDYMAVFVGRGDRQGSERLAEAMGVAARCFWIDSVKNSELALWYSWCDCFCAASLSEGFGIVFIEAAASGAAIVTSNIAPMNEYLVHGQSAHLLDRHLDPAAMAAALRRVCEDESYRSRLSVGAQAAARAFDRHKIDALEAEIYAEAMALPRRPAGATERASAVLDQLAGRLRRTLRRWRGPLRG